MKLTQLPGYTESEQIHTDLGIPNTLGIIDDYREMAPSPSKNAMT